MRYAAYINTRTSNPYAPSRRFSNPPQKATLQQLFWKDVFTVGLVAVVGLMVFRSQSAKAET